MVTENGLGSGMELDQVQYGLGRRISAEAEHRTTSSYTH